MNITYLGPVCVCVCVCETHTHTVCLTQQEKDNNKTQVCTKIHRHLGTGHHKDLFKNEDSEMNQMKHMLDHVMCKFEDSGKKIVKTVEGVSLVGTTGTSRRTRSLRNAAWQLPNVDNSKCVGFVKYFNIF